MSISKNACKRLSIVAGVHREEHQIIDHCNILIEKYIQKIVSDVANIVIFSGKKTITVSDVKMLCVLSKYPQIVCPTNLDKLVNHCTNDEDLQSRKDYPLYTLRKPFEDCVRSFLREFDLRIGKNVITLLQTLTEHYIIVIMSRAKKIAEPRETLLLRDLKKAVILRDTCWI